MPLGNVVMMMNFICGLPKGSEEAAFIDGINPLRTMIVIMLPLLTPDLATLALFTIVGYWNEWFAGMMYMSRPENYPLQTYLRSVINTLDTLLNNTTLIMDENISGLMQFFNTRTARSAQIVLAPLPLMMVFPSSRNILPRALQPAA